MLKHIIYTTLVLILIGCGGGDNITEESTSYFVSTTGDDSNDGSENSPFKTIQKAADLVAAGETVFIKAGTYKERVEVKSSGTKENEIVFKNYANDEVIIDGKGITWWEWNGLFDISAQSYITISGLRVINSTFAGFFVEKSQHIRIEKSTTYNTFSSGIGVWESNYTTITNNEVELACNDGGEESISVSGAAHCVVSNNEVHNNGAGTVGGEGIDIKDGSHHVKVFSNHVHNLHKRICIYVDAWNKYTHSIEVYGNRVHDCNDSGIAVATEMGGKLENVSIYNNIVYNNPYGGIEVGDWVADKSISITPIVDMKIINNTLYNNQEGINIQNKDARKILVSNNICSKNTGEQLVIKETPPNEVVTEYNLIDGYSEMYGTNAIIVDAMLVDAKNGDFHLQEDSPAIDSGIKVKGPLFDYDMNTRPINGLWDLGAYEFVK